MGKKKDVSAAEKQQIVECLGQGMTTINIAKTLHRDHRTITNKIIFMHDYAPSHAAKNTSASLAAMGIKGDKLMVWPPCSPDLNPIENLWSIIKRSVYDGGRQFTSKQQLWEGILSSCKTIEADTIQNLTNSMDERVQKLLSNKGSVLCANVTSPRIKF
ncbi:hypothetical protein MHYP_G00333740 [Metynnis hypsauchen]